MYLNILTVYSLDLSPMFNGGEEGRENEGPDTKCARLCYSLIHFTSLSVISCTRFSHRHDGNTHRITLPSPTCRRCDAQFNKIERVT